MKNIHLAHAGLNKPIKAVKISQDGTLREVKGVYISHHGRWAKVYDNFFEITHTFVEGRKVNPQYTTWLYIYHDFNMRTWLLAQGWDGESPVRVTLTFPYQVTLDNPFRIRWNRGWKTLTMLSTAIRSSNIKVKAFVGGGPYPDGSSINVNVNTSISGMDLSREIRNSDGSNQWTVVMVRGGRIIFSGGRTVNGYPINRNISLAGRHVTLRNYHRWNIYGTTAEPFKRPRIVYVPSGKGGISELRWDN